MIHLIDKIENPAWSEVCKAIAHHKIDQISFYINEFHSYKGLVLILGCPSTLQNDINKMFKNVDFVDLVSSIHLEESLTLKEEKYELIIIPFLGIMSVIDYQEQEKILGILKKHIIPTGKLIFDMEAPDMQVMLCDPAVIFFENQLELENQLDSMIIHTQRDYQEYTQTIELKIFVEFLDHLGVVNRKIMHQMESRYTFRWEMHNLLNLCGLKVRDVYGDYYKEDFTEENSNMIWVAEFP